jgi:hypothetical protein
MSTIVTRNGKGSALTWTEMDSNFTNLNTDKIQSGDNVTLGNVTVTSINATTYTNIPVFNGTVDGLVNAGSNSGTLFLRDDGTWAVATGVGTDLTYTAATRVIASSTGTDATLPLVASADAGLAPASGGGTTNFLRADGTWAVPPGGSATPAGSTTQLQYNNAGAFGASSTLAWNDNASYSAILSVGNTFGTAWSNTVLPVQGIQFGDRGALTQYSGTVNLGFNTKINSAYAEVAITASGTPAVVTVGAGDITLKTASANPGAGSAITFTTVATAKGADGNLQLNCGQLVFPATQNPSSNANTLDDYEEGTWTPTVLGSTSPGTGTYTSQTGRYVKVGKTVTFSGKVVWTNLTGTGNQLIGGLPFTSQNVTDGDQSVSGTLSGVPVTSGSAPSYVIASNTTEIILYQTTAAGVLSQVPKSNSGTIYIGGTYICTD